jgi:hypothetical protein
MKKNLWMFLGVIAAVVLSGCGAPVSTGILDSDWCYLFDFTKNQQGFTISAGTMLEQGLSSDATGLLQASYGYDRDVYPNIAQVRVFRPGGVEGDIAVTAAGTIFGLGANFTAPLLAELDSAELTFTPDGGGIEYIGDRNAINFTIDATQPIGIESIFIGGMGASPFPYNLCADPTPTPPIDLNGTGTAAAGTPSPTVTITATGTAPTATCVPSSDDWGWGVVESHSPGTWTVSSQDTGSLHRISWGYQSGWGSSLWSSYLETSGVITSYYIEDATGESIQTDDFPANVRFFYLDSAGPFTVEFAFDYESESGCDATTTPTTTPTAATSTPSATSTQEPLWSSCLDFTASDYSYEGIDATYEDGLGWVQDAGEWSVGRAGQGPSSKKQIKFVFNGPWAGSVRAHALAGADTTGWILGVGPEFAIDLSEEEWIPTQNFRFEFDGNFGPYVLEKICWIDLAPSGTPVPSGSRTPLPTVTGTQAATRTPVLVPNPPIYITATAGMYITTTPIIVGTGVYNPTGTPSFLITGTPGTEGTPGGDGSGGTGYGSGGGGFGDVGDILGFGWNIGWGMFGALIAYLGQAGSIVTSLLTAFANSTPQPIPGLPLCMTNPMAHDLCAVYYILDNTIFAQATPGALIIPLLLIMMNMWIAVYFVRWVLRIIRRGEQVTDVE